MIKHIPPLVKKVLRWFWKGWVIVSSIIGSLILILFIVGIIIGLSSSSSGVQQSPVSKKQLRAGNGDVIAVVNMTGPIVEDVGDSDPLALSSTIISSKRINQLLYTLAEDSSVDAVVLRMNTPGGTVVASDDIYQAVRYLREKKPVVTSMGDVAASGGYYIAAGGSKIVANPATITGSIGVIAQFPRISGLYDKLGIEMRTLKSGTYKDIGSPDREMSAEERAILDSIIDDSYQQFVSAVIDGREMDPQQVIRLADGRIFSGRQAKDAGLVDELGNIDTAITVAEELADVENSQVIEYGSQSFFESLFGAKFNLGPLQSLNKITAPQSFKVYYLLDI